MLKISAIPGLSALFRSRLSDSNALLSLSPLLSSLHLPIIHGISMRCFSPLLLFVLLAVLCISVQADKTPAATTPTPAASAPVVTPVAAAPTPAPAPAVSATVSTPPPAPGNLKPYHNDTMRAQTHSRTRIAKDRNLLLFSHPLLIACPFDCASTFIYLSCHPLSSLPLSPSLLSSLS